MATTKKVTMLFDVRTSSDWASQNPVLKDRQIGFTREGRFKIGDGVTKWNNLAWADPNA